MDATNLMSAMNRHFAAATNHFMNANAAIPRFKRTPKRALTTLEQSAKEIKWVANRFRQEATDLDPAEELAATLFEQALRTMSGAIGMVATGLRTRDANLLCLADGARLTALDSAKASFHSLMPDELASVPGA